MDDATSKVVDRAGQRGSDVAWRLPGALMGAILVVVTGSMLGPPGRLLALLWRIAGLLRVCRFGERAVVRTVLR